MLNNNIPRQTFMDICFVNDVKIYILKTEFRLWFRVENIAMRNYHVSVVRHLCDGYSFGQKSIIPDKRLGNIGNNHIFGWNTINV